MAAMSTAHQGAGLGPIKWNDSKRWAETWRRRGRPRTVCTEEAQAHSSSSSAVRFQHHQQSSEVSDMDEFVFYFNLGTILCLLNCSNNWSCDLIFFLALQWRICRQEQAVPGNYVSFFVVPFHVLIFINTNGQRTGSLSGHQTREPVLWMVLCRIPRQRAVLSKTRTEPQA